MSCLFCRIAAGEIAAKKMFEDELSVVFADVNPQAPTHVLVIPREHFADVTEVPAALLGHLLDVAARQGKMLAGGFRIAINTGPDGGQTVQHVHLHVLGGRPMGWPPG